MTDWTYHLMKKLLTEDCYLAIRESRTGRSGYMLYSGNQNPEQWFSDATLKSIRNSLKKDKQGRFTLNLSLVRQQHGKSLLKQLYKKYKNKK